MTTLPGLAGSAPYGPLTLAPVPGPGQGGPYPQLDMATILKLLSATPPPAYNPAAGDPNLPSAPIDAQTPTLFAPNSVLGQQAQLGAAAAAGPNAWDQAAATAQAQGANAGAQMDVLNQARPKPDDFSWENYTPPPYPTRESVPVPQRQAPRSDPMATALAVLAGFISPRAAGEFGAAPMQGAQAVANQQYEDALRGYEMRNAQVAQTFADAIARRGDQVETDKFNREGQQKADNEKSDAELEFARLTAPLAGDKAGAEDLAKSAATLSGGAAKAAWATSMIDTLNRYSQWRISQSEEDRQTFLKQTSTALEQINTAYKAAVQAHDDQEKNRLEQMRLRLENLRLFGEQVSQGDQSAQGWAGLRLKQRQFNQGPENDPMADPRLAPLVNAQKAARAALTAAQTAAQHTYDVLAQNAAFRQEHPDSVQWQSTWPRLVTAKQDYDAATQALEGRRRQLWPNYTPAEPTTPSSIPGPRQGSSYQPGTPRSYIGPIR